MTETIESSISKEELQELRSKAVQYCAEKGCDIAGYHLVDEMYVEGPDMECDKFYHQRIWVNPKDEAPFAVIEWRSCPHGTYHDKIRYTEVTG